MDKQELLIIKENELLSIVDEMNFKIKEVCKNEKANYLKIKDVFLDEGVLCFRIMFVIDGENESRNFVFLDDRLFFGDNYYYDGILGKYEEKYEDDFVIVHRIMKETIDKVNLSKIMYRRKEFLIDLLCEIGEV